MDDARALVVVFVVLGAVVILYAIGRELSYYVVARWNIRRNGGRVLSTKWDFLDGRDGFFRITYLDGRVTLREIVCKRIPVLGYFHMDDRPLTPVAENESTWDEIASPENDPLLRELEAATTPNQPDTSPDHDSDSRQGE